MAYYPLPAPQVPDWGDVIDFRNKQEDRARQQQAYGTAADALTNEDYGGAVNALTRIGQIGQASLIKDKWQSPAENAELNTNVGNALANGNWKNAENIALRDGNIDLANQIRNRQNAISNQDLANSTRELDRTTSLLGGLRDNPTQENWELTKRAALASGRYSPQDIAKAEGMISQIGIGPTADFYHRQLIGHQGQLQEIQKQREPIINGLGQLSIDPKISDEDWPERAANYAAAHSNPEWIKPYLTEQGRAMIKADAGLTDKAIELANKASRGGAAGTALAKNAAFIKASFETDNPDVAIPQGELNKVAANPRGWELRTQTTPDGSKQAIAVQVSNPKQGAYGLAAELQAQNRAWNEKNPGEEPRETDLGKLYEYYSGLQARQSNAASRAKLVNPESVENIAEARSRGSYLGKSEAQQAERIAPLSQLNDHIDQAIQDADNAESKKLFGRIALSPSARSIKETLNPSEYKDALGRRNVLSDVELIREETQRFFRIAGSGALTDVDKARIDSLLVDLERSPNSTVFKGQLAHLRDQMNAIAKGATAKGVLKNPDLAKARSESAGRLGQSVTGGNAAPPPAPREDPLGLFRQ